MIKAKTLSSNMSVPRDRCKDRNYFDLCYGCGMIVRISFSLAVFVIVSIYICYFREKDNRGWFVLYR